jgi:hypothetical protein
MQHVPYEKEQYPNIALVAEMMDCTLMAKGHPDDMETNASSIRTIYMIGTNGDPTVGIFAREVTPNFGSLANLETFCEQHKDKYEEIAQAEVWPDRLFWDTPTPSTHLDVSDNPRSGLKVLQEDPLIIDYRGLFITGVASSGGTDAEKMELLDLLDKSALIALGIRLDVAGYSFPRMLQGVMGHLQRTMTWPQKQTESIPAHSETIRKTDTEIEELKAQWLADGCWDIEDTEGFEAHRTELYIWRLEVDLKREREGRAHDRLEYTRLKDALNVVVSAVNR